VPQSDADGKLGSAVKLDWHRHCHQEPRHSCRVANEKEKNHARSSRFLPPATRDHALVREIRSTFTGRLVRFNVCYLGLTPEPLTPEPSRKSSPSWDGLVMRNQEP